MALCSGHMLYITLIFLVSVEIFVFIEKLGSLVHFYRYCMCVQKACVLANYWVLFVLLSLVSLGVRLDCLLEIFLVSLGRLV